MVRCDHASTDRSIDQVRAKSLKRQGLSRYYAHGSQSFACLELALCTAHGEGAIALAKLARRANAFSHDDALHASPHQSSDDSPHLQSSPTRSDDSAMTPEPSSPSFSSSWPALPASPSSTSWPTAPSSPVWAWAWTRPAEEDSDDICAAFRRTSLDLPAAAGAAAPAAALDGLMGRRPFHAPLECRGAWPLAATGAH